MKMLFRWPDFTAWRVTLVMGFGFAVIAASFGLGGGLFEFVPVSDLGDLMRTSLIAFFLPSLLEELVFRGPLIWLIARRGHVPVSVIMVSLGLFVLWHPLNALVYLIPARPVFFDPQFLIVAAGLGAVASFLAVRTRSLWPPVMFHWLAVVGWKAWLGAPAFF